MPRLFQAIFVVQLNFNADSFSETLPLMLRLKLMSMGLAGALHVFEREANAAAGEPHQLAGLCIGYNRSSGDGDCCFISIGLEDDSKRNLACWKRNLRVDGHCQQEKFSLGNDFQ